MATIREARDRDAEPLRDLFVRVYGEDYPYPGFYDTEWIKKAVYDDFNLFLVAEADGELVASGTVILNAGGLNDLMGEVGRLVASPSKKARGAAREVVAGLLERIEKRVAFAFSETRTIHPGAQRLSEEFGWSPVGFQPLKYQLTRRESMVVYAHLQPLAVELRRNNPRVIPEVAALAQTALHGTGLPADVIVEDETEGYPTGEGVVIERLEERGVTPLLRIERGRVTNREVFGNFSLARGFFNIANSNTQYLVARDGQAVLGAVGFTWDPIDSKLRVFELIEFDETVKGYLLARVDQFAREEFHAAYEEVDVSAYSPKIQRTLERLGFVPVAYCPSMVFENVERLDVVRMAKINVQYDLGRMRLRPGPARIREIVERGLEDRLLGMEITQATRGVEIFRGLPDGDLYHLARIARVDSYEGGTQLIRQGEDTDQIYILVDGAAEARSAGRTLGRIDPGAIFGEMGLVEHTKRSADVVLTENARVIEIPITRLTRLMEAHPRLGYVVMQNLAGSLSQKLRAASR